MWFGMNKKSQLDIVIIALLLVIVASSIIGYFNKPEPDKLCKGMGFQYSSVYHIDEKPMVQCCNKTNGDVACEFI